MSSFKLLTYNDWLSVSDPRISKHAPKISSMLAQTPEGSLKDAVQLWSRQRRLSIEQF